MREPGTYTYQWDAGEHARVVNMLNLRQLSSGWRVWLQWSLIASGLIWAAAAVWNILSGNFGNAVGFGVMSLFTALSLKQWRHPGARSAKQMLRHDPALKHPITDRLDPEGFQHTTRSGSTRLKWAGMYEVNETPEFFLFFLSETRLFFLPKRVLAGPEEAAAVRGFIRARLPESVPFGDGVRPRPGSPGQQVALIFAGAGALLVPVILALTAIYEQATADLENAVVAGDQAQVQAWLDRGGDVEQRHRDYDATLLAVAAGAESPDLVRLLLRNGANVAAADRDGWTPLHWAAGSGRTAAITALLEAGADPNARDHWEGTALMLAANGYPEAVAALVEAGADVHARNEYGDTALMSAARWGDAYTLQILLEAGADPYARNNEGETALDMVPAEVVDLLRAQAEP